MIFKFLFSAYRETVYLSACGERGSPQGVCEQIQYLGRKVPADTSKYCTTSRTSVLFVICEVA